MDSQALALAALFFAAAALYSSVGHAGASAYIALMALAGLAPSTLRPTALVLNIVVGSMGLFRFHRAQLVPIKKVWPFVLASAPCAYFAAQWPIPNHWFKPLLGLMLLAAAFAIAYQTKFNAHRPDKPIQAIRMPLAVLAGASIGVLSGLTGTGGAIFLTPLLLLMAWAPAREASGISVAFVVVNSITALLGLQASATGLPGALPLWIVAVAAGALLGTHLGIERWPVHRLRYALCAVLLIASTKLLMDW